MSEPKTIEIRLHPDGTITGTTKGMKGTSCLSAITLLEHLIDARVTNSEFTDEFYEEEQASTVDQSVEEMGFVGAE